MSAIDEPPGKQSQTGGHHLSEPGDEANLLRGGAEVFKHWADDAARALVGHVSKETDNPNRDDKTKSFGPRVFVWFRHLELVSQNLIQTVLIDEGHRLFPA
jgi:hypothetical protein